MTTLLGIQPWRPLPAPVEPSQGNVHDPWAVVPHQSFPQGSWQVPHAPRQLPQEDPWALPQQRSLPQHDPWALPSPPTWPAPQPPAASQDPWSLPQWPSMPSPGRPQQHDPWALPNPGGIVRPQPPSRPQGPSVPPYTGPNKLGPNIPPQIVQWQEYILEAAEKYQLDPALIAAVMRAESNGNANAVSSAGATGLMQLMPATGERFGLPRHERKSNPRGNVLAGAAYLRFLLDYFNGNLELAIAGYNAGEGAVDRSGRRVPRNGETEIYVPRVLNYYQQYKLQ